MDPSAVGDNGLQVVYPALIGVAGIVVGALLSWIPVCLQLRHATREREKERQMSLRRDVYLFAVKQIGEVIDYMLNLYWGARPMPAEYTSAMGQVHMVGSDEVVQAAIRLNSCIAQASCILAPKVVELNLLNIAQQVTNERVKKDMEQRERCLEEMRQYNLQGAVDTHRWATIQGLCDLAAKMSDEALDELKRIVEKQITLTTELAIECAEQTRAAERLLVPFIMAVRRELGTVFDSEAYHGMMKTADAQWERNVASYISSMRMNLESSFRQYLSEDTPDPE